MRSQPAIAIWNSFIIRTAEGVGQSRLFQASNPLRQFSLYGHAGAPLRDAMDLAYLTGQRPADALLMTEHDIVEGHLIVTQVKTKQPLRIVISGNWNS